MDGFGNINWWGFSPCIDLIDVYKKYSNEEPDTLNILLLNAGDQRHILKSLVSKKILKPETKVRFYIYEKMLELYARDLLLISIALEHPAKTGIQEKTENYLELFGNLFIRDYTSQIIQNKSNDFIKFITDLDYLEKSDLNLFDFSLLKYKERDFLEGIFKFWRIKETNKDYFTADKCWDLRLRTYFGNRYDSKSNAYDWDFSMKLADRKNAAIINNRVYSKWRDTGLAFELRDANYDRPNKTLASGMVFNDPRNGDKTSRRGYFGDIIVGPFLSYGIEHNDQDMFKKSNESYKYTCVDVARSNLDSIMNGILESSGSNYKNLESKLNELKIVELSEQDEKMDQTDIRDYIKFNNVKIIFLPLTAIQDMAQKSKYDSYFDIVYFSNSGLAQLDKSFGKVLKKNSVLIFETAKFMIEMSNDQINLFSERIKQIAKELNLKDLNNQDDQNENINDKIKLENSNYFLFKNS